ncbi:MAG: diaminopimelate decarboxylase, partial [Bacteroidaceae bacterium]|nr:diaminopimelate decarboxylase [Bacteroidaceae bacterium]
MPQTPFYYYDLALLERTLDALQAAIRPDDPFCVHYAFKSCYNADVARTICARGLGADCVSEGEVKRLLELGFPAEKLVFAGVGKTDEAIDLGLQAGIGAFNVENLQELEVISERAKALGKTARVAFRINPNVDAHTHEKITTGLPENKFGIALEDTLAAIERAHELPGISFIGLHFHIGSQVLDATLFAPLCAVINQLQDDIAAAGFSLSYINVGGGLGVDYEDPHGHPIPDFESYFEVFRQGIRLKEGQQLHFELGRSITAQCGTLYTKVLFVKEGKEKRFVILDAGFTDLVRVAMYGAYHHIENVT